MLRLDGSGVTSPEQAAEVLGTRSVFPAKKALAQANRLGTARIARAVQLLARADLDLRGTTGLSASWSSRCWWPGSAATPRVRSGV